MKIAHVTTVDLSLRHLLGAQLRASVERGDEVVAISAPGPDVPAVEAWGVRHVALTGSTRAWAPLADVRAAAQLWRVLRTERPDVLHTHNPKPGVYGRIIGRLAGVRTVVNTNHGLWATPDDPWPRRLAVYAVEGVAARFSDAELVQNPEDLDLLARWRLAPVHKLTLLGNGVDLARFEPDRLAQLREDARAELEVDEDDVVVGSVGRLVAEKGFPELFEAARELPPRCVVVVVGPDEPDKRDGLTADMARTAGRVRLLGFRDDVERLYAAFDVFVLASHREGYPRAAMEAAAAGLPLVVTDVRGCRQVVDDGVNGYLVSPRDPGALAEAISRAAADPERRRAMGRASRAKAEADFDERRVVRTVLAAYARAEPPGPVARRPARTRAAKRLLDMVGSGVGLVLLSPVLALVALLVRVRLGRPILFVQERPGRDGRSFRLYKFRTMTDARGPDGRLLPDADRLTPLGLRLRARSLDELPELWNVLRGDMSLVGPRPLLTRYLDRYRPDEARRHTVKPGITGWAQVNGRNATTWEERLALDAWYADNWSLGLDLRILARTVPDVLARRGISHPDHDTMPELPVRPDEPGRLAR